MTLSTLNLGNNGNIVYLVHAGFLVSTVCLHCLLPIHDSCRLLLFCLCASYSKSVYSTQVTPSSRNPSAVRSFIPATSLHNPHSGVIFLQRSNSPCAPRRPATSAVTGEFGCVTFRTRAGLHETFDFICWFADNAPPMDRFRPVTSLVCSSTHG